jgi:PAS domain S-box-containing protein
MAPRDSATIEGITAAWQATTAALRESERQYRELVECSLGLICTHDLSGTILSINSASANSLGYEPGHGIGRNLREFLAPDKRHLFDDYLRRIQELGQDTGMMSVVARDGTTRVWKYRNVLSRRLDGTPYVLGHAIDITDRVEVERSLRHNIEQRDTLSFLADFSDRLSPLVMFEDLVSVVQSHPVPFVADVAMVHLVGDDGSVTLAPAAHGSSGYEPMLALAAARLVHAGAASTTMAMEHLDGGTAAMVPMIVNGAVKAVLSLVSERERRLRPSNAFVLDEMTRRIRLALDRIQLYREAQEANRLKDEFLGTLSHELRTPLNAIFGWAKILRTRPLDPGTAHAVEVIERNAHTQIRLIEEVLDVSRIITSKMTLAAEPVDLRAVLRAAIDMVRPGVQAKRIRIDEHFDDVPPVIGDAHRLQQVFGNLLSNALKFTGEGGTITVALRAVASDVEFEISDTGVGIRREVLPFVFDRFRQADASMTRTHGGLGLGLAIVRHIAELHGGSVRAMSAGEGHGATFVLRLPSAERGQARAVLEPEASGAPAAATSLALSGRTILVVEDHDDARELIAGVLEEAGARVVRAATTREALEHARQIRPDVLLADLGLPGEDGFALLAKFRAIHSDVPAVALTAYARVADRDRVLAAGFLLHVIKPVDPSLLVDLVASIAARR